MAWVDPEGREARLFGAAASGAVALYDTHGILAFSGGITGARGHSGDNAGRSAVVALLTGRRPERARTFVFGCDLLEPTLQCTPQPGECP